MNKAQLLSVWNQHFTQFPTPNLRKELMVPILGYRIQEREFGGLSHAARMKLRELAKAISLEKGSRNDTAPRLKTGTRLIRVWKGELHEVNVSAQYYEYRGQAYDNLSVIACKITGTRWSGPLFFGAGKKSV